jgi:hypothetical protein
MAVSLTKIADVKEANAKAGEAKSGAINGVSSASGGTSIGLTLDRKLTKLEKAVLLALDDIVKPNEAFGSDRYNDDNDDDLISFGSIVASFNTGGVINIRDDGNNRALERCRALTKRTSTHCFSLEELRKRIESDGHRTAFTKDEAKDALFGMLTLSVNKTIGRGKDSYDRLFKIFDSISIDHKDDKVYFSFGQTFYAILKEANIESFGRMIVGLKHKNSKSKRKR